MVPSICLHKQSIFVGKILTLPGHYDLLVRGVGLTDMFVLFISTSELFLSIVNDTVDEVSHLNSLFFDNFFDMINSFCCIKVLM